MVIWGSSIFFRNSQLQDLDPTRLQLILIDMVLGYIIWM